ncbi:MAG TPA: SDR family NAD(P)-dependent oxidoreductase [Prolixibacteraceae bacterium]|jgi:NAD(P)-dependent dehydrogenase (short-subunit alcohol dehydrogenase family)
MTSQTMPTALITGANRGIGFEIARQLLKKGFQVIISGRDELKLSEAIVQLKRESASVEMLLMDVSKLESINAAASLLRERHIQLDVVINNAAILLKEDLSLIGNDDGVLTTTINTNCNGPMRIIQALLPLIKTPGRIINLSSGGGSMSEPVGGWSPAYCVSKTMLNSITRHLAFELSAKQIAVNAVCPGWVRTNMGGKSAPRSVEKGAETPVWLASEASGKLTGKFFRDQAEINW